MNIFKSRTNSLRNRFLSTITIFSLFCYILFGLGFVVTNAQTQTWDTTNNWQPVDANSANPNAINQPNSQNVQLNNQTNNNQTGYIDWNTIGQSPVITPSAMDTQMGPPASAACGISVSSGKWNYCMLAPVNGLIGSPFQTTLNGNSSPGEIVAINNMGLQNFFSQVYKIGIMAVIALAIVMISFGGIRLATTDSVLGTDEGRKMINAAVAGLFLALFSYVLLNTINPALLSNGSGTVFPTINVPNITPAPEIINLQRQPPHQSTKTPSFNYV